MSNPTFLRNSIRSVLKLVATQEEDNFHCYLIIIPTPPYLREKRESIGIKLGENCHINLKKVNFHSLTKAVDMFTSCGVKAKAVGLDYCETGFFVSKSLNKKGKDMGLDLKRVSFKKVKKGVVAPDTYDIKARDIDFEDVDIAFDIYIGSDIADKLSLPANTPQQLLDEVKELLTNNCDKNKDEKTKLLEDSRLFKWLDHATTTASLATALISMFA